MKVYNLKAQEVFNYFLVEARSEFEDFNCYGPESQRKILATALLSNVVKEELFNQLKFMLDEDSEGSGLR